MHRKMEETGGQQGLVAHFCPEATLLVNPGPVLTEILTESYTRHTLCIHCVQLHTCHHTLSVAHTHRPLTCHSHSSTFAANTHVHLNKKPTNTEMCLHRNTARNNTNSTDAH